MTARERIEAMIAGLPTETAAVVLTRRDLRELIGQVEPREDADGDKPLADLTCAQAGAELGRTGSTIRAWCAAGRIPGAYRLGGREWRLPRASLRRFLDAQAERREAEAEDDQPVNLGRWRRHLPGRQAR